MTHVDFPTGRFYNADCFDAMKEIPDGCVDLILADLPYGTTMNKWDSVLPLDKLWEQYWRVCNGAIVLTASQPFTTALINSEPDSFRYALVWNKTKGGNFVLAKKQPMKSHEDILIFSKKQTIYNPQMEIRGNVRKKGGGKASTNTGIVPTVSFNNEYYPTSILTFSTGSRVNQFHPTQKPVALFEYLIRTYTNEGALILDNTAGSGTTAIAAINTNRRWVCIEKDEGYYAKAIERIETHIAPVKEAAE